MDWFKGTWILSRYPVMKKGRVVPPFEQYDKEDAKSAIDKAKFVFNIIGNVLEDRYGFEGVHNEINKYE